MNALLVFLILIICVGAVSASEGASMDDAVKGITSEPGSIVQGSNLEIYNTQISNLEIDNTQISNSNEVQGVSSEQSEDALGEGETGNSWYVKAGASGGDGSEAHPYANLKQVTSNSNYQANDIIFVMGGTYKGTSNTGTSIVFKENTTITAYNDEVPIFDAQTYRVIFNINQDGIVLKGLTLVNGGGINVNQDGISGWAGGAIYNNGNNLVIDDCTIKDGDPVTYGTGIFSAGNNTVIKNSRFSGNSGGRGGAICIYGKEAQIIGNEFSENQALYGGAIYVAPTVNAQGALISNNKFDRNRANQGSASSVQAGGSIYMGSVLSTIANNNFTNCRSGDYGGAMAITGSNNVIDNCSFDSNQIFDANSNTNWGGAIYIQGDNTVIKNSNFTNNGVMDNGGALYVKANELEIENCRFEKNIAGRGGAIYFAQSNSRGNITNPVINKCNFTENGVDGTKGGAIYSWALNTRVINSNFNNNTGLESGAILYERGPNFLENDTFTGNKAVKYGGGAISSARFGDKINNCTFTDNHAQGYGGAVSCDYPNITNSKFVNNHANHGGAICTITANVYDCEFYDNTADDNWVVLAATKLIESNNIHPGQVALSMNHTTYLDIYYDQEKLIAYMDGYYAYCMEEDADYPQYGVLWENLRFAQNALDEERIGEYLKILIYTFFVDDSEHNTIQKELNIFTDHDFRQSDDPRVQEVVRLYDSGFRVPTENAFKVLEDGTIAVYNFKEVITPSATQNVFAFKIDFNPNTTVEKDLITSGPFYNGKSVDFNITVTNTGECNLTKVFVNDTDFSDGLIFESADNAGFEWYYDDDAKVWILNQTLEVGSSANIILTFKMVKGGNLTNNVTSGLASYTFSNDTENLTVFAPNMTLEKISNNKTVKVGEKVSFTLIMLNAGDCNLTGIYIRDDEYSNGLEYFGFNDNTGKWKFKGNGLWEYDGALAPGKSASLEIIFTALTEGEKVNTAFAGNNITNETVNCTNTTNVTESHENGTNTTNVTDSHENSTNTTSNETAITVEKETVSRSIDAATGNPILVLVLMMAVVVISPLRRKK